MMRALAIVATLSALLLSGVRIAAAQRTPDRPAAATATAEAQNGEPAIMIKRRENRCLDAGERSSTSRRVGRGWRRGAG